MVGCHGRSDNDSDGSDNNGGRGMGGSSCQYIAVAVAALGFGLAVMTERISRQRKVLKRRERESGERMTGKKCRDDGEGEEW